MISHLRFLGALAFLAAAVGGVPARAAWNLTRPLEGDYTPRPVAAFARDGRLFAFTEQSLVVVSAETGEALASRSLDSLSGVRSGPEGTFVLLEHPKGPASCRLTSVNGGGEARWSRDYPGVACDRFQVAPSGETWLAGLPGDAAGNGTFELTKIDCRGSLLWTRRYRLPGNRRAVFYFGEDQTAVGPDGSFALAPALYPLPIPSNDPVSYLAKIAASGAPLWGRHIDEERPDAVASWLKSDAAGHLYARFTQHGTAYRSEVARFSPGGRMEWRYALPSHLIYGNYFVDAKRGGLIVVDDEYQSAPSQSVELTSLTAAGAVGWRLSLPGGFEIPSLAVGSDGTVTFASGPTYGGASVKTRYWGRIRPDGTRERFETIAPAPGTEDSRTDSVLATPEGVFVVGTTRVPTDPQKVVPGGHHPVVVRQRRLLVQKLP